MTNMYRTCNQFLYFWVSQGTWIFVTTWLKPIWIISVVKFLSFTLTDIFLNAFSAKTSIENQHPKTTSNQKKEARSKNNFEKARKRAPKSKLSGTFYKLGRPNIHWKKIKKIIENYFFRGIFQFLVNEHDLKRRLI